MYWFMQILHGFSGYSLIGADYKLTIFKLLWRAGIFCADAQPMLMRCTKVVYFSKIHLFECSPREAPRRLAAGFGI